MKIFWLYVVLMMPLSVAAQTAKPDAAKPIEITAAQELVWDRDAQLYRATGRATAIQGGFGVAADEMIARYQGDQSNLTIIEATGQVEITNDGRIAKGDKAVYTLQTGEAVLTGRALSLAAPDAVITARDRFTVNTKTNIFNAYGNAVADQAAAKRRIEGQQLQATFAKDQTGKTVLSAMRAEGTVKITAGDDVVTGDVATYNALTKQAEVTGGTVTLTRGPNVLTGERATVDLNTNISRLFGGATQPAKAVFYPKSGGAAP